MTNVIHTEIAEMAETAEMAQAADMAETAEKNTSARSALCVPVAVFLFFASFASFAFFACGNAPRPTASPQLRSGALAGSNVLLVTIDTLRADHLGCYGHAAALTPTIDGLAARGVRFATAVAHVPLTGPSHASLLTGRTPLGHGFRDNGGYAIPAGVKTAAEDFRQAGYRTAAFVSGFPLDRRFGFDRGFDTYDDHLPRGNDPRPPVARPGQARCGGRPTRSGLRLVHRGP